VFLFFQFEGGLGTLEEAAVVLIGVFGLGFIEELGHELGDFYMRDYKLLTRR
jgi:hypothetical protein